MNARTRRVRFAAALLAVPIAVLGGCTGVPTDSAPSVIKTVPIGGENGSAAATTPAPGTRPNTLVADFLQANALDASQQTSPRGFLSPAARNSWSDTSVTVVDAPTVGFYNPKNSTVVVKARLLGTVDSSGVYTPTLERSNSRKQSFTYIVRLIDGQWRITGLAKGLLLSESDFVSYFTQRSVYYFDLAHRYLVPDPRWTSLRDPTQLADFLMAGLANDPSSGISNVVSTDTLPIRATASRISVNVGATTKISIPGASQLGTAGRNRLAEVVAVTLADVVRSGDMVIDDGGKAVEVPSVGGTHFSAADFVARADPPLPPSDVYFLRGGYVYGQAGQDEERLKGAVNVGTYDLQSVALSQDERQGTLAVAATAPAGAPPNAKLLVGTQSGGLRDARVRGTLTRPAFAPGRSEVWVGDGRKVYVVVVDNEKKTQRVIPVGLPSGAAGGQIIALRLSPEGSRIALVIRSASGDQQLYVGAVFRQPGQVRIGTLQQVTPEGVVITDVAWAESLKLFAIGYASTGEHHIYDVGCDGSGFSGQGTGNLPGPPTSLTVAVHQPAWVTASTAVWRQGPGNLWLSPGSTSETSGYGAIYLE